MLRPVGGQGRRRVALHQQQLAEGAQRKGIAGLQHHRFLQWPLGCFGIDIPQGRDVESPRRSGRPLDGRTTLLVVGAFETLDFLLVDSGKEPQLTQPVDLGLHNRELNSEKDVRALVRELEGRLLPLVQQGGRVRIL